MNQKKILVTMVIMQGVLFNPVFAEELLLKRPPKTVDSTEAARQRLITMKALRERATEIDQSLSSVPSVVDLNVLARKMQDDLNAAGIKGSVSVVGDVIEIRYADGARTTMGRLQTVVKDAAGNLITAFDQGWHAYYVQPLFSYAIPAGIAAKVLAPATTLKTTEFMIRNANKARAALPVASRLAIPLAAGAAAGVVSQRYFSQAEIDWAQNNIKKYTDQIKISDEKRRTAAAELARLETCRTNLSSCGYSSSDELWDDIRMKQRDLDNIAAKIKADQKSIDSMNKYIADRRNDSFFNNLKNDVFGPDPDRELYKP